MITQNISTNIFVSTISFFFIMVLFRKVLIDQKFKKNEVVILPLLFFIWYGGSKIMTDMMYQSEFTYQELGGNIFYLFVTIIYILLLGLFFLYQSDKIINIIYLTLIYIVLVLISIYL
jgi:hypothetical protein